MNDDMMDGQLRSGLGRVESALGEATDDIGLKLRGRADQLVGQVQTVYGDARDTAEEAFDQVDAFVTGRPYMAAALAAFAGLALGFVMGVGRPKVVVIRPAHTPRT